MAQGNDLLRHGDFVKLWIGQTISLFGSQFTLLALPLVAILMLAAGPAEMGLLVALETAPFLMLGLFVGVWVDRYPRRPVLIIGDVGRALCLLLVPAAALLGFLSMPLLYVVSFTTGVLTVFFEVAYQAHCPPWWTARNWWRGTASWRPPGHWPRSGAPASPELPYSTSRRL